MLKYRKFVLFSWLLALQPLAGTAQVDTSLTVCGKQLSSVEVFDWTGFSTGAGADAIERGNVDALFTALRGELVTQARGWPTGTGDLLLDYLDELVDGRASYADFKITTTGDLPKRQFAFYRTSRAIELPPSPNAQECAADPEALREMAKFVELGERAVIEIHLDAFKLAAEIMVNLEQVYDKYLFEGFPMFPWEAAVNSWLLTNDSIADGPPRWQMALAHPSAGVLAHFDSDTDGDIAATLLVEAIGAVRYTSSYDHWYGASIIVSFPTDREPGYGIALNYDQFKLGVTWHDDPGGQYDGAAVFLSFDFYQLVGEQVRKYNGYKDKVRSLLEDN